MPYVIIVYDVYPDTVVQLGLIKQNSLTARIWNFMTRLMLRAAERVVVIGRDMAQIVACKLRVCREGQISLIPNWSDPSVVRPLTKASNKFRSEHGLDSVFVVQYSGTMGRTHRLETLLEAAALVKDEGIVFQFIGDGAMKVRLQELATNLGVRNVQFLAHQPIERLAEVLTTADLAVVCLDEKFTGLSVPSKAYGIMAAGVPILGLLDPMSEIGLTITETGCGVALGNGSAREIAEQVRSLSRDRMRLEAMGRNGYEAFLRQNTLGVIAESYDRLLVGAFDVGKDR